ncbi:MAG: T9SS type A sorting domain-containing protein [Bacteroidales bacterium]|nr:T9SS type A sorting domain-containing protein [Bacteroidales bacterium]
MKRNFLSFFLVFLFFAFGANAQVDSQSNFEKTDLNTKFVKSMLKSGPRSSKAVYVNETFDTEIPATWTIVNTGTGTLPGWYWKETDERYPFTGFAVIDSDSNGNSDLTSGYLISPAFHCSEASVLYLDFDVRYNDLVAGGEDVFQVDVWDGSAWQNIIDWDEDHGTAGVAEHVSINISAYVNAACRVRFFFSDDSGWNWYAGVDNVLVSSPAVHDLAVTAVSPSGLVASGSTITPSVTIENMGMASESNFVMKLVSDPAGYDETITDFDTIAYGNTLTVDFPDWTPANGNYTLSALCLLLSDGVPDNNIGTSQIVVRDYAFGDLVHSFNASTSSQAGVETDGNYIYCSTWNSANFYKYTMDGVFVKSFTITGAENIRDLTYNPLTQYFYGSDVTTTIYEMDFEHEYLMREFTCPTETRAIFYDDDSDLFWSNNWDSDLIGFYIGGGGYGGTMPTTTIYGATYDNWSNPANPTFWKFTSDAGTPPNTIIEAEFGEFGTHTGRQIDITTVPGYNEGIGGGLASFEKDGHAYLLASIQQNPNIIAVFYLAPASSTGIAEFNVNVSVVPNPSNGIFTVSADQNYLVDVLDLTGRVVESLNMSANKVSIDLSSKKNGMYIVRLTNENGTKTVKVVKR